MSPFAQLSYLVILFFLYDADMISFSRRSTSLIDTGYSLMCQFPKCQQSDIVERLEKDIISASYKKNRITRYDSRANGDIYEYHISKSKPIIDEIDKLLAKNYGFTEEELDFIINYDIKYRMGDELNKDEE